MTELNTYDPAAEEARAAHIASTEEAMRAAGVQVEEKVAATEIGDYWAVPEPERWYFPDGIQYIEFQPMTEAMRSDYQSKTMTQMSMNRASGDSRIGINVARDRRELINTSVVGWKMFRGGAEVAFKDSRFGFNVWIREANPRFIEDLEKAIRAANPWMQADMDTEEIKAEIERLQTLLVETEDRQLGESGSSNK